MPVTNQTLPWVSFCISTYKRPELLKQQIGLLLNQSDENFEIVISDNDEEGSAEPVINSFEDSRIRYFKNEENLGMIRSFNKSIERASTEFIVMVTDDDPIERDFLDTLYQLFLQYPDYSIYCGFQRPGSLVSAIEIISADDFPVELLDPKKTSNLLWSSAVMRRDHVLQVGLIPDYGSPHLADHAFMAKVGSIAGGVVMNKMFSSLSSHETNFSKSNFDSYVQGCEGFYHFILASFRSHRCYDAYNQAVLRHLGHWFISNFFNLKKYFTKKKNKEILRELDEYAKKIRSFDFMKRFNTRFYLKSMIFSIKKTFGLL